MNKIEDIDYNKILNCICSCKRRLSSIKDEVVMAYPCEHLFHDKCFNNNICTLCSTKIEKKLTIYDKNLHHQRFADILSMSYYCDLSKTTFGNFVDSFFEVISFIARVPIAKTVEDAKNLNVDVFATNNLTLKVYGMKKLKKEEKKVYICNHASHYEFVIMYYLFESGFLASNIINNLKFVSELKRVMHFLTFNKEDKNRKNNVVEEMKKFIDKYGNICIFPEGIMKHPNTLIRFRSGAFHTGYPVYSITIKYNDIISDEYFHNFAYKLGGKRNMSIEVYIDGPYYPPFNEESIENIRRTMAKKGKLITSRVSDRDISINTVKAPI